MKRRFIHSTNNLIIVICNLNIQENEMNSSAEHSQCDRTPIKQRLRKSYFSQTEKKVKQVRNRRLSSCNEPLNFTTTSPLVEKIEKKPLAQGIISPSQCFVSLERLRLNKIGLQSNIILRSSQNNANDDTRCDITECDVLKPIVDVQSRRHVVHPRFVNDSANVHETSDSDEETEDLLNSTFTFLQHEENSSHVDEKGEPNGQDYPDDDVSEPIEAIDRRLTFDKDDIKGIDSNEIYSKKDTNRVLIQEVVSPSVTLEDFRCRNINFALGNESKASSIVKRLAKSKKLKNELGKLSSVSKTISRNFHFASFGRTPTISGSKALQLYEYLSGDTHKNNNKFSSPNRTSQEPLLLGSTPPSGSSTPKILKKHVVNSLLKSTLKKRSNNVSLCDGTNNTSAIPKRVKLGKIPNFASLHKKHFEKMENISEYMERKSERAKLLLSGNKLYNDTLLRPKNKKIVKALMLDSVDHSKLTREMKGKSRVLLPDIIQSVSVDNKENVGEPEIPDNEIVRKSKKQVMINISPETPQKKLTVMSVVKTPYKTRNNLERVTGEVELPKDMNEIKSPQTSNAIPINNNDKNKPLTNSRNLLSSYQSKSKILVNNDSNITRRRPVNSAAVPVPTVHNSAKEGPTARTFNTKSAVAVAQNKLGHTRFGFTVPVKLKKVDAIKAVCNKSRIANTNQKDEKRTIIKGVRSNRRFDLLMQMRSKQQ